jgi:GxxExxY protein
VEKPEVEKGFVMNDMVGSAGEQEFLHQQLTKRIIGAAMEVHTHLGPGYMEHFYEDAMEVELTERSMSVVRQVPFDVFYKTTSIGQHRLALLVEDAVVLELKSVEAMHGVHIAQLRSTLKAAGKRVGLLLNFNVEHMRDGIKRVII